MNAFYRNFLNYLFNINLIYFQNNALIDAQLSLVKMFD